MSKAWGRGSTSAWRKLRASVLLNNQATNGGMCMLALACCTGRATQAHHVLGKALTGDDPKYLLAVCGSCNLAVGDPQRLPDPPHRPVSQW